MPSPTYNSQIYLFDTPYGYREVEQRQRTRYGALENAENSYKQPVVTRFMAPAKIYQQYGSCFCPACGYRLPEALAARTIVAGRENAANVCEREYKSVLAPQKEENPHYSPSMNYSYVLRTNSLLKSRTSPQTSYNQQLALSAGNSPQPAQMQLSYHELADIPLEEQFVEQCIQKFQHEIFSDTERLNFFDSYYNDYALPVTTVYRLLKTLQSEQIRLDAVRICMPNIPDLEQRWDSLCALFRSRRCLETYKREVKAFFG